MSVCKKRLYLWLVLAGVTVAGGVITDLTLQTSPLPLWLRLFGVAGMLLAHFPLKRTGRLLARMADPKQWGCTNRLMTSDLYRCLRHPHHLFIGVFMTSLGLAIGHPGSLLIIAVPQWLWILGFLILVEEKELMAKFGEEYAAYRRKVPMLLGNPACLIGVLSTPTQR